jgi:hypothetical protein
MSDCDALYADHGMMQLLQCLALFWCLAALPTPLL